MFFCITVDNYIVLDDKVKEISSKLKQKKQTDQECVYIYLLIKVQSPVEAHWGKSKKGERK